MNRGIVIGTAVVVGMISVAVAAADFDEHPPSSIRIATFNIQELSHKKLDEVDQNQRGTNQQLLNCAEILRLVRPDVVLINEIDAPSSLDDLDSVNLARNAVELFVERYLAVTRPGLEALEYPYVYIAPSNTGIPTGKDLDNDGRTDGPADSFGFGRYPGEYGMALLSRFPIAMDDVRTFRKLLWREMPGHLMPDGKDGRPEFHSPDECQIIRLSSKSHWDVPLKVGDQVIHLLCSHPTPPVFDGPEDNNGRRNFDEVRLWAEYLTNPSDAAWLRDDQGKQGGLSHEAHFVILGDLNAEPVRGDPVYGQRAIDLLLKHPRVFDPQPKSLGAEQQQDRLGLQGYLPYKTSDFGRLDYVLPSKTLRAIQSGVFWPASTSPLFRLVETPQSSSDHRLVWVDLQLP